VSMAATTGGLQIELTEMINCRMVRSFQNAWFAFPRAFVIHKTNDNYPEKFMDCVEI
jgi:hypothetical protein